MNNVALVGRLTKEPELRYMPGVGTPVATFTIAIDREYKNKNGKKETDFIPVEVIGKTAEYCANYIPKGRLVSIQGSIRIDRYVNEAGETKTFTKINASQIKSLESSNKNKENNEQPFVPGKGLEPHEFESIDDNDIPF